MSQKKNVPKRRFKEFLDAPAWEQHRVGEYYAFKNGVNKGKAFFGKGLPIVNFTDVFNNREITSTNLVGRVNLDESEKRSYLVKQGDIFFTRTSEVIEEIGFPSVMMDSPTDTVFSGFVLRGRSITNSDPLENHFKKYVFFTEPFRREMQKKSSMTTRALTSGTAIKEMDFVFPANKNEQKRIGEYLTKIEALISMQLVRIDKLKVIRDSYLSVMFPTKGNNIPKLRFKGFTDAWEQRKLEEISPVRGGYAFRSGEFLQEGIPVVRISNILTDGTVGGEFIHYKKQNNDVNYILKDGSAVIAMSGATTGKVARLSIQSDKLFYQNQRVGYFQPIEGVNYNFVCTLVKSDLFLEQLRSILVAGAQPNISAKQLGTFEFIIPIDSVEQSKIGDFTLYMDSLISLHQRKLDKLKALKEAYLSEMFV